MPKQATRYDFLWGYLAQGLNIGAGLILLPVILHYLNQEDVGLWFVFVTLGGLAQLLEFGFQPTLARNTAYIHAGSQNLSRKGIDSNKSSVINVNLYIELIATARLIYRYIAIVALFVLLVVGTLYIYTLLEPSQATLEYLTAWSMFAIGYVATFYFGYFNGLLQGRGDVSYSNKVIVFTKGTLIIVGTILVVQGFGILGLGIASMVSAIAGRLVAGYYFFSKKECESVSALLRSKKQKSKLFKTLWHNSWRLGLVHLGAFLIQRSSILIASSSLGLAVSASYSMTITVFMTLMSISNVVMSVQLPYMSYLQANKEYLKLRYFFGQINIISWLVYITGFVVIILFGNDILAFIKSDTYLLSSNELIILGVIIILELNHSVAATYLTTTNEIPFLKSAIISGVFIVLFGMVLVQFIGVWGLLLSQGLVQLAYNNWKWPHEAIKHLGGRPFDIYKSGFMSLNRVVTGK